MRKAKSKIHYVKVDIDGSIKFAVRAENKKERDECVRNAFMNGDLGPISLKKIKKIQTVRTEDIII